MGRVDIGQLLMIGVELGIPLAQSVFAALREDAVPTNQDGTPMTWAQVQADLQQATAAAKEGGAIAQAEIDAAAPKPAPEPAPEQ